MLFDDCYADSPAPIHKVEILSKRFALAEKGIDPDSTE